MLFDTEMVDTDTSGLSWTRQHPNPFGERAVLQFVGDSWRGEEFAVDSYLSGTACRCGAKPQVMLAGAVDLGLEADSVESYDCQSTESLSDT